MYHVYLLKSLRDGSSYVGFTENLEDRLKVHNRGGDAYTSQKYPFELVWSCTYPDKRKALAFEKYLKSGSGRAFLKRHLA